MSYFNPQNPGLGGLDEITDAETLTIQSISALGDPGADRILFWDDSAGDWAFLTVGSGLSITDTTLSASGGGTIDGSGTTNEISYWVDSDTLGALAVATYPSLTELSYVKGVTSALQTQLDAKQPLDSDLTTIAGLTATTDNFIVSVSSAWASRTPAQVKTTLSLNNVENTALSTWAGSTNITTLGTISSGTWNGTDIALADGGTGASLADPGADRIMAWDDSAGAVKFSALTDLNTEAAPAAGDFLLAYTAEGALVKVDWDDLPAGGTGTVDTTGTPADNQIAVFTDADTIEGASDFTFDGADVVFYNAANDGNPEVRLGAADAEEVHIQAVFDSGAQTLSHVLFTTDVASATADKGLYRFNVDGSDILDIDDGGINLAASRGISIAGTDIITDVTGTATLSNIDALDSTTEDTIEAAIFDSDTASITGVWTVADDVNFQFGTNSDWAIQYDEGVDDQLLFMTAKTSAIAITDPMFEILVDTGSAGMTANQQVFGVAKGSQASNTPLFTVDEDGDGVFAGTLSVQGFTHSFAAALTIPADPNADRFLFWDDSAGVTAWLTPGNGLTITTTTIAVDTASTTVDGIVELATAAETTTGTDTGRAVTPDGLAGSDFGKKAANVVTFAPTTDVATGDGAAYLVIPDGVGGMNLILAHAYVITAGTTNTTDIQIHNVTQTADMLSTKITIDTGETSSRTAATPPVIDGTNDDVADGDVLRIDVDAVSTTAPKGLIIELVFQLP